MQGPWRLLVQEGLKRDPHAGDIYGFPRPGRYR